MPLTKAEIKESAIRLGAEKCGISSLERFSGAPAGFKPTDIYSQCKSVLVFLKSMPGALLLAESPVPYSHAAFLLYDEIDRLGLELARFFHAAGIKAVSTPCSNPYLHWEPEKLRGMGILSLRHAAVNAGLGYLGKNTLLINKDLGNMVYIGAVLLDLSLEADPLTDDKCPGNCEICLEACPPKALDGITVTQKLCRPASLVKTGRGFDVYICNKCRKSCPRRLGYGKNHAS